MTFEGHFLAELRLVFHITFGRSPPDVLPDGTDMFLTYLRRIDIIPQLNTTSGPRSTLRGTFPEQHTTMYVVKRAERNDGSAYGDIIPLYQLRDVVDLVPRFGQKADTRLTTETSYAYSGEFFLNKYFTKDHFYALRKVDAL
jgi:hypothetical protein